MPGYAYPGLGSFPGQQAEAIRMLWDAIHTLREGSSSLDVLTPTAAAQSYSPSVMQTELSGRGNYPLNVEGLLGVLADPQRMGMTVIPSTSALPAGAALVGYFSYETISWNGRLYYLDPSTNPAHWVEVAAGVVITYGTLSPDTKPAYGTGDAGKLFASTDFNRIYLWTGGAWQDMPGSERRGVVVLAYEPSEMGAGWALCDGSATTISTPTGGTAAYTTPDLINTPPTFPRFNSAEGGTGGAATAVTAIDLTAEVHVATGTDWDVSGSDHVHLAIPTVPPYMDFVPYIRL